MRWCGPRFCTQDILVYQTIFLIQKSRITINCGDDPGATLTLPSVCMRETKHVAEKSLPGAKCSQTEEHWNSVQVQTRPAGLAKCC